MPLVAPEQEGGTQWAERDSKDGKGFSENSHGAFSKFPIQNAISLVSGNDLDAACVACWWLCGVLGVFIP